MRDVIAELREEARHDESEYTPGARGYRAFDDMAVELEVAEFLFALVRIERPAIVIESGAGRGFSTLAIAGALERNGAGHLISYESEDSFLALAEERAGALDIEFRSGDSRQHEGKADMVFLDSGPATREREILFWLSRRTVLIVHDAYRYPLAAVGGTFFRSPRGLWIRTPERR